MCYHICSTVWLHYMRAYGESIPLWLVSCRYNKHLNHHKIFWKMWLFPWCSHLTSPLIMLLQCPLFRKKMTYDHLPTHSHSRGSHWALIPCPNQNEFSSVTHSCQGTQASNIWTSQTTPAPKERSPQNLLQNHWQYNASGYPQQMLRCNIIFFKSQQNTEYVLHCLDLTLVDAPKKAIFILTTFEIHHMFRSSLLKTQKFICKLLDLRFCERSTICSGQIPTICNHHSP